MTSKNIGDVLIVYHRKLKEFLKTQMRLTKEHNGNDNHWVYGFGDLLKIERGTVGIFAIEESLGMSREEADRYLRIVKEEIEREDNQ